jgi:hypothetical protein
MNPNARVIENRVSPGGNGTDSPLSARRSSEILLRGFELPNGGGPTTAPITAKPTAYLANQPVPANHLLAPPAIIVLPTYSGA